MTTENSPAQKSFDINKYKINITDREVVDVEVGDDKFQVEIKPLTWFRKNKDIQWYRSSTELVKDIKN